MWELAKWLLTVIIGGAIGGAVAFKWQKRGWLFQQKLKRVADKYEIQMSATRDFFNLVDKRVYASRLYLSTLLEKNMQEIAAERERYKATVFEWNEKISGLLIVIEARFRDGRANELDGYFLPAFSELDRKLRAARKSVELGSSLGDDLTKSIRGDLYLINHHAREVMYSMLGETRDIALAIDERPSINISNIDDLTSWYLFKSLFQARL